jgi:hypothetical protein
MRILLIAFLAILSINSYAQLFKTKKELDKFESERKKITTYKIHEVKAYKYDFVNGNFDEKGVLAEQKQYNKDGLLEYEFSSIDPDLSYTLSTKTTRVVQYSENQLTDGGAQTLQAGTDYIEMLYELPSVKRWYTYENNKISRLYEKFNIDNDSSYSIINYTYRDGNLINEQTITNSIACMVSTNRDYNLNSDLRLEGAGPWVINFYISYSYDENHNLTSDACIHPAYWLGYVYKYDMNGNIIAKKQGLFTRQSFKYDSRNNLIFADIQDALGKCQIKYAYDNFDNLIEFERVQLSAKNKKANLVANRYKHCFYSYNDKNLLTERLDKTQTGETICKIKYTYWFDGDYTEAISEQLNNKLAEWLKKGKYESTQEYQERASEQSKAKQTEIFKQEVINELGEKRYSLTPSKMDYNPDNECFIITFTELAPIEVLVPRTEAEYFEKNITTFKFAPQFSLGQNGLMLKSCIVKNHQNNKEYRSK